VLRDDASPCPLTVNLTVPNRDPTLFAMNQRPPSRLQLAGRALRIVPDMLRAGPAGHLTAGDLLERVARRRGNAPFIRQGDRVVSYADVNAYANRVAHWARARDIGRGSVVGLLMENRPDYLAMWMGLAKVGAVTALINTNLRAETLAHSLRTAGCAHVILGAECADAWASLSASRPAVDLFCLRDGEVSEAPPDATSLDAELAGASTENPPREVRAELRSGDPLFFIYTSGTTGLPKAARLSHSRFLGGGIYALLAGLDENDVLYCPLPLYHTVGGVMCVNGALRSGATLALARHFSASHFWDDVAHYGATAFQYIGELCRYLVNQPPHPLERSHALRFALGNGLRPAVWKTFQERFGVPLIVEFYGATESNVAMVNLQGRTGSVGKAPPALKVALVRFDIERGEMVRGSDGRCQPCDVGEPGELLGRIPKGHSLAGRFEGYTSREETERKILRGVFEEGDAWFRTGDLLYRDADGYYYFVDRIGDTFRWKGENVSTQEVAEAVTAQPGVEICAVYGVELPGAEGRAGMAAVVLEPGARLDGEALFRGLEAALPAYARPAFVRIQTAPEMTGTFKLRKVELQKQGFDPSASADPILYRDDTQGAYVRLDSDTVLRIDRGEVRF
jgi:fatty-acyl-CoA synthase